MIKNRFTEKLFFLINNYLVNALIPPIKLWAVFLYMDTASYRAYKRGQRDWFEQEEQLNGFMINLIEKFETTLFIDVGACFGMHSFQVKKQCPKVNVASFEPNKFLTSLMKKSKRKNKLDIEILNYGLGENNYFTELNLNYFATGFSSIYKVKDFLSIKLPVEVKKLDFYNFHRTFKNIGIKIDIEGFEANFLNGATETLSEVKWIIIELDNQKLSYSNSSIKKCLDFLYARNFKIKQIDYNSHKTIKLRDINLNTNKCYEYYAYKTF